MPADVAVERLAVAEEALTWIGTPFHHAARIRGVGVDCAQLLVGVFTALELIEQPEIPFYPPNWFLHRGDELLKDIVSRYCAPVAVPQIGDIVLFHYGRSASHGGIMVRSLPEPRMVHAFVALGVIEDPFGIHTAAGSRFDSAWTLRRWVEG